MFWLPWLNAGAASTQQTPQSHAAGSYVMHARSATGALELKVPPVALVIIVALMMRLGGAYLRGFNFQFPSQSIIAWVPGLLGVMICAFGIREFKRAKTTVNPTKPRSSSALVTSGIYRRTRNPMYLGFLLILAGWAVITSNMLAFLALPAFVLYMNRFQIEPEERALSSIFGEEFKVYRSTVRRWL